jgi:hypothetical protein
MSDTYSKITMDKKHNLMLEKFNKNDKLIPKYNQVIEKLKKSLNKNITDNDRYKINTDIDLYNKKIDDIKNQKLNYWLDNSKLLFTYFEDKKNITNNNINNSYYNNKLDKFFSIDNRYNDTTKNKTIIDKYFRNTDDNYLNYDNFCYHSDICLYCHSGEMIYMDTEGLTICNNCSKCKKYFMENEKPSYKEPPKEVCFYAYKRINHLREILAQFQAKETTQIPDIIFENIKNKIKKERIELSDLTNNKTKEILKNLGYNKYYEHIPFIKDKLGIKPPVMTSELEETLCNLFIEIQKPYSKYCPKNRVNFLNYYYTIYKLCELLDQNQFLEYFPMLKDREKRIEQDQIWKNICEELNWTFIPTL